MDKGVKHLIHSIFNDFGFQSSSDFIDGLQNIVTEYMKTSSFSVGISDLIANNETNAKIDEVIGIRVKKVNELIYETQIGTFMNNTSRSNEEEFETRVNGILNDAREEAGSVGRKSLDKDNRFVIMVNAGSKGNNINISQMISCLGQQNIDNKRISYGFQNRALPHFQQFLQWLKEPFCKLVFYIYLADPLALAGALLQTFLKLIDKVSLPLPTFC